VFTIPEDNLPEVLQQMHRGVRLPVDAYDRGLTNKLATGELLTTDNEIDTTTGTIKLKALFPNKNDALFPNQFVNARLLVDTIRGAVIVPSAAIQRSPQSTFVYRVKPDSTVEMRDVTVRLVQGEDTGILRGLSPGDVVVTDGVDKLQQGTKVIVEKASPAGGQAPAP
jgi:multidrug efflux system membrane fusion protein